MSNYYERKWARCFFCDEHSKGEEPLECVETKWVTGKRGTKRTFYFHKSCYQNAIKSGTFWDFKI